MPIMLCDAASINLWSLVEAMKNSLVFVIRHDDAITETLLSFYWFIFTCWHPSFANDVRKFWC